MRNICLLTRHEAELLRAGYKPKCREHQHVTRDEALLLIGGAERFAHKDPSFGATGVTSERFKPTAEWAIAHDGKASSRHLVMIEAREWQARGGVMQWLPIGATKQRVKRGRSHLPQRSTPSLTQCFDTNHS